MIATWIGADEPFSWAILMHFGRTLWIRSWFRFFVQREVSNPGSKTNDRKNHGAKKKYLPARHAGIHFRFSAGRTINSLIYQESTLIQSIEGSLGSLLSLGRAAP